MAHEGQTCQAVKWKVLLSERKRSKEKKGGRQGEKEKREIGNVLPAPSRGTVVKRERKWVEFSSFCHEQRHRGMVL